MTPDPFRITYKGVEIKGSAYVDGHHVEITELDIDAIDLLGICDNNTLATFDQLILEYHLSNEWDRAADYQLGYRD